MVGHDGRVRVMDFGLTRAAGQANEPSDDDEPADDKSTWCLDERRMELEQADASSPRDMAEESETH